MHPLVARILAVRALIKALEADVARNPRSRGTAVKRQDIMRQSIFLDGLETAASLTLTGDDMTTLLNDLRAPADQIR